VVSASSSGKTLNDGSGLTESRLCSGLGITGTRLPDRFTGSSSAIRRRHCAEAISIVQQGIHNWLMMLHVPWRV
jgi:hypothetical protein